MTYPNNYIAVIPAYNEVNTLREIVQGSLAQCKTVIVIDDASTDGSAGKVRDLPITLLKHEFNQGKAASLWDGIQCALEMGADYIISLDADGQHLAADIPKFIQTSESQPDQIIIGSRLADRAAIPAKRYYANKVANFWISWACGYSILDSQSGFRLYPARLFKDLKIGVKRERCFVFESEILIKASKRGIKSLPIKIAAIYQHDARPSHFRPVLDIVRITRMVAWSLVSRGFYLQGIYSAFIKPQLPRQFFSRLGLDGFATLCLSTLFILLTLGISFLGLLTYCFYIAKTTKCANSGFEVLAIFGMKLRKGKLTNAYKARLHKATELIKSNPSMRLLIMGGITSPDTISEAEAGKRFLLGQGIKEQQILIEDKSRSTLENLKNGLAVLDEYNTKDILIITNRYHLARIAAQARGFAYHYRLCPAEDRLAANFENISALLKEAFYLHWYMIGKVWSYATNNKKMLAKIR